MGADTGPGAGVPVDDRPSRLPLRTVIAQAVESGLPPTVRRGRLTMDRRGASALAAVGLAAVLLGAYALLRAKPSVQSLPPPPVVTATASTTPSPSPTQLVVVDVQGKVKRPGVVSLPAGSRIIDALRASGGVLTGADTTSLNLARILADGEQVVVGVPAPKPGGALAPGGSGGGPGAGPGSGGDGAGGGPLDLNSATLDQLQELPGVGPVLAQRILDWRDEHGRFTSVDDLRDVDGIGERRFAELKNRVRT